MKESYTSDATGVISYSVTPGLAAGDEPNRLNIPTTYVIAGYGDFSRQESEFLIVYLLMARFGIRICRSVPSDAMIKLDFT